MTTTTDTQLTIASLDGLTWDDPVRKAITSERTRLDQAVAAYQQGKRALYRSDGAPQFTDHDARLAQLAATTDPAFNEAEAAITAVLADAQAAEEREATFDPSDRPTPDELARANSRALFVREDAETLPISDLAARLREVADGTDRALLFVWGCYAGRRLAAIEQGTERPGPQQAPAIRQLSDLIAQMRARFVNEQAITTAKRRQEVAASFYSELRQRHDDGADGFARRTAGLRSRYGL